MLKIRLRKEFRGMAMMHPSIVIMPIFHPIRRIWKVKTLILQDLNGVGMKVANRI